MSRLGIVPAGCGIAAPPHSVETNPQPLLSGGNQKIGV